MTDYSQLYLIWPPIAILLIGLLSGWFLQRHVLVRQMEDLETQHLDLLRSAEEEVYTARDEARLQGQKLDEAQLAIQVGYERLTLLHRRLKEAEERLVTLPGPAKPEQEEELARLRQKLAQQEVFSERLNELERELQAAKSPVQVPVVAAVADPSREHLLRTLRERAATIESLRHEVAGIEELRARLSELVSELGAAQAQLEQVTKERNALAAIPRTKPTESANELVRKLADAIARRQELEIALGEANRRLAAAEADRERLLPKQMGVAGVSAMPKALAAAAGGGLGFPVTAWQAQFPPPEPLDEPIDLPVDGPRRAAYGLPVADPPAEVQEDEGEYVAPAVPLLSPAQLAGGLSQLLFENRIQFAPDRADILPDSKLLLEDIADLILSSVPVRLCIEGHTERGDARASFYLSERRALAVLERLAKLGVPEMRMISIGYGDTRAIDENATYEGRMRNRRVEIRVLGRT
ncbi:MAG: OmpA family protein [Bryobacteraceae bacterium]|nr:OmpA family protein [Bryobacteraceae bacterium]